VVVADPPGRAAGAFEQAGRAAALVGVADRVQAG
jgi:hypothetical protein